MAADVQRLGAGREHGRGPAATEAVAAVPAVIGRQSGRLAPGRDDGADGLRTEAPVAGGSSGSGRWVRVRRAGVGVPAAGRRAHVAPAVDAGEQRARGDAALGQEGRPRHDRADRADPLVGGVVDPADHSPCGPVGLRRPDRDREALGGHQLEVAEVERRQFGTAGEEGEAEQHDGAVAQSRRRVVVAGGRDRRQVRRHDRDGLARTVAAVAGRLPAPRRDDDLPRGQGVGRRRPGAAVHRPDRREVGVNAGGLQPSLGGEVRQVGGDGLRGGRQRDPARLRAPRLERPPPRPVGDGRVFRHRLRDQRGGGVRDLEVGQPVIAVRARAGLRGYLASCCYQLSTS